MALPRSPVPNNTLGTDSEVLGVVLAANAFENVKDRKKFKIFKNNQQYLGIIFDDEYIEDFIEEAKKIDGKINVYVFSYDESVPTKEFKSIKNKVTLCPIPETILKVYRKVFKNDN